MSEENKEVTTTPATVEVPTTKQEPAKPAAKTMETPAKAEASKAEEKPAKAEGPKAFQMSEDADDEIPENAELIQLSKSALTKRLARHSKRELREHFGTDDPADIKAKLAKYAEYETKAEEERRKSLSDLEKEREDRKKAEARAAKAEKSYQRAIDRQEFASFDAEATSVIGKHFDPKFSKFAMRELKDHVREMDEKEAPADAKKASKLFEKWAEKYVKENPGYARPEEKAPEPEPKKIALTTGPTAAKPNQKAPPAMGEKTLRPGLANSMSKAEVAAYKKAHGLTT